MLAPEAALALVSGEQERRLTARGLQHAVLGRPDGPADDVARHRLRGEEGPACLPHRRGVDGQGEGHEIILSRSTDKTREEDRRARSRASS